MFDLIQIYANLFNIPNIYLKNMKEIIRKILKEEVTTQQDNYQRKMIEILKREGFDDRTPYQKILNYLNSVMSIVGMEAFEMYQLFKDNVSTVSNNPLVRKDIKDRKMRTANVRSRDLVINRIPFKGNNTHAEYRNGAYVVFSYGWYPVFVYKDGQWFENEEGYSMSTKKQMSQMRPWNQGEIIKTNKDKLWDIIKG
tara:strand:- start:21852 stop:22442 length:591 start_codon:yes stop_codon:yes gene_type:complete